MLGEVPGQICAKDAALLYASHMWHSHVFRLPVDYKPDIVQVQYKSRKRSNILILCNQMFRSSLTQGQNMGDVHNEKLIILLQHP